MDVNIPSVVVEVRTAFERYEAALVANLTGVLDELFWDNALTVRYGVAENLYGIDAIRAFRRAAAPVGLDRELASTVITSFGRDFATVSTLFRRTSTGQTGRQTQSWARTPAGWRVVAAHVSLLEFDWLP